MINQNVYSQIDTFVNKRVGKSKLYEIRFYVDSDTAKDKANFVKWLKENDEIIKSKKLGNIIDLCYGSGNLTTHILGDANIEFLNLNLNDINIADRNNNILIGTKSEYDFLDSTKFSSQYDLIIFNPQIGGKETYSKGIVEFEKIGPILYNGNFIDYLNSQGIDTTELNISSNEDEKSIFIHSEQMTKSEMTEKFKDIKIFNYYDVLYRSKESKIEGTRTNIVKFRQTLEKISHTNSIIIFYGESNYYNYLFADYKNIRLYLQDSTKQLFVLSKEKDEKKCFEFIENKFIINNDCVIAKNTEQETLDIGELMQELENHDVSNNFANVLITESSDPAITNDEEAFQKWWYASDYINADGKKFEKPTKNAYFNGIKRLSQELGINLFSIKNIEEIENLLDRLETGDLKDINIKQGYNPSNGLKQYIKFLRDSSNKISCESNNKFNEHFIFSNELDGSLDFEYKNILFKGVPGTGKSRAIDKIIEEYLKLSKNHNNVLRINIHSASSNSDLMQGIGISTNQDGIIKYSEKQGLILDIIKRATFYPNQPFVLILEEIQENSLNELIGDLIYLIEDGKRAQLTANNQSYESYETLVEELVQNNNKLHYVEIPYLVNDSTDYKKMIMPDNLFIFCTSNYRDDKKIIEDNLLRRLEVIEIYPNKDVVDDYAKDFFQSLNTSILNVIADTHEMHPDRFMIGHAIWKDVNNVKSFYKAFSKLITEFKDIREIEFAIFNKIIQGTTLPTDIDTLITSKNSYYDLIVNIQEKIGYEFID